MSHMPLKAQVSLLFLVVHLTLFCFHFWKPHAQLSCNAFLAGELWTGHCQHLMIPPSPALSLLYNQIKKCQSSKVGFTGQKEAEQGEGQKACETGKANTFRYWYELMYPGKECVLKIYLNMHSNGGWGRKSSIFGVRSTLPRTQLCY